MRATKPAGHVDRSKPLIRAVKAKPPATLEIAWRAGENSTVDVARLIKRFKLYAPLRNAALFTRAKADPWGHAVNWPGEIDMGGLPVVGNFYHCNGRHHSMALIFVPVPEFPKKLDHIMIETVSMDNVGHAYDRALAAGIPIARDLGRHGDRRGRAR